MRHNDKNIFNMLEDILIKENYDNNIYKKKLRKRKNVEKKELDIDMKENSQNNEEIITDFFFFF